MAERLTASAGRRSPVPTTAMLVTCEHARATVPAPWREVFAGACGLLASHRGFDPGALALARAFARGLGAPLYAGAASRLIVELNRSLHHRELFSARMQAASAALRQRAIDALYRPHRDRVLDHVRGQVTQGKRLIHLGVHTFVPRWRGVRRAVDVGLLYDPHRVGEAAFCRIWKRMLQQLCPTWRVRCNAPYRGQADGLTTSLRRLLPPSCYWGIELEVTQAWMRLPPRVRAARGALLVASWRRAQAATSSRRHAR